MAVQKETTIETIVMLPGACPTAWVVNDFRAYFEAAGWNVLTLELRHHDQDPGKD